MQEYDYNTKQRVRKLRNAGKTYTEIKNLIGREVPKSTISYWCRGVALPSGYPKRMAKINQKNLDYARKIALSVNRTKRSELLDAINKNNFNVAKKISDRSTGLIALGMLCLGEASKYKSKHKQFSLGSSDPRIIIIFLALLKRIEGFEQEKIRCTVQCRADQNVKNLEKYWRQVTKIPKRLFYGTRIDPRTVGKPTVKNDYKGVLVVDYYDRLFQLRLETLADLVYNQLKN